MARKRITARELTTEWTPGDYSGDPKNEEMLENFWELKLKQAKTPYTGESLYENIKNRGQQSPVSLNFKTKEILDGHHRIAALNNLHPEQFVKYKAWDPDR